MTDTPEYEERQFDFAVFTDKDGRIICNTAQQDLTATRRTYPDGTVEVWVQSNHHDGGPPRLLIPRYDPREDNPKCRHCGEVL